MSKNRASSGDSLDSLISGMVFGFGLDSDVGASAGADAGMNAGVDAGAKSFNYDYPPLLWPSFYIRARTRR